MIESRFPWWTQPALLGALLVLSYAAAVLAQGLPPERYAALLAESGWIESLTAFGFIAAAGMLLVLRRPTSTEWWGPVLLIACALRELEMHRRFTTMSILKSRFYLSDGVPLGEKLAGLLVLCLLALGCCRLLWYHRLSFWHGLKTGSLAAGCVASAVFVLVLSQSIDGVARKLAPWGVELSDIQVRIWGAFEEIIECAIPLLLMTATLAARRSTQPRDSQTAQAPPLR